MDLKQLRDSGYILLDVVAGSHMYGLSTPESDIDHRGIFNLPIGEYIKFDAPKQVACDMNDEVYYEMGRFLQLAASANPNILEIMFAPERSIVYKDPKIDILLKHRDKFLTKACAASLGGYAVQQIRKARGQNKMVTKPEVSRKTVLDFCYVALEGGITVSLKDHLAMIGRKQSDVSLTKVANFNNTYCAHYVPAIYEGDLLDTPLDWKHKGMVNESNSSNELRLSSIPEGLHFKTFLISYNKDGYTAHCRDYKSYTDWVKNRNPARYAANLETLKTHKKFYDKKNMMHCMRLLTMGTELAKTGKLNVYREDREYLLSIRRGELDFDTIMDTAEAKLIEMEEAFKTCGLPDSVDKILIENILRRMKLADVE